LPLQMLILQSYTDLCLLRWRLQLD
jgi:hypothetical protein